MCANIGLLCSDCYDQECLNLMIEEGFTEDNEDIPIID